MVYTIEYGVKDICLLDVTAIVYDKCVVDNHIMISVLDDHRAKDIFNEDPVPCVQKFIYVTGPDGSQTVYDVDTSIDIAL